MEQQIIDLLMGFVQGYPAAASVFMVLGIMRAIFKPACALFEAYISATPSKADDEKYAAFKSGKIYFVLDYLFSIKIPK